MTTNLFDYKKYLLAGLFLLPFVSAPSLCYSEETPEEMHNWAPVAGRVFLDYNSKNEDYILTAELIWDNISGFTSPEKINTDKKAHAFEMSLIFNDCERIIDGKDEDKYSNYCDVKIKPKFSEFVECNDTALIKYVKNSNGFAMEETVKDCTESSLIDTNFPKEAGFYFDTRAADEPGGRDFAFGLYDASKIEANKVYRVKFKLKKDNISISKSPVLVKVNKGFDIAKDEADGVEDFYPAFLKTAPWYVSRQDLLDFCCLNGPVKDVPTCRSSTTYYDLGRKQACVYEEYLGYDNIIIDAQDKRYRFCNAACYLSSFAEKQKDETCYKDCYDFNAKQNSVYLTWCLDSKDSNNFESDAGEPVVVPKRDKNLQIVPAFQVQLFQCSDVDYRKIKPDKTAWYDLELKIPPGTNFDFILYKGKETLCSAKQKTDFSTRNQKPEKCSVLLEKGTEYLIKFSSEAARNKPYGGWFSDFIVSYYKPFSDVSPDTAYAAAIHTLYIKKIIKGYDDGTFKPDQNVNRPQFMKMLIKTISTAFGSSIFTDQCNCNDPAPAPCVVSKWWKKYTNCSLGYPSSSKPIYFWPINKDNYTEEQISNPPLTRGEVAKILAIAKQLPMSKNSHTEFTDIQGHRYQQEIAQCIDAKIFSGYKDAKLFKPDQYISRGEAAEILVRAYFEGKYRIY